MVALSQQNSYAKLKTLFDELSQYDYIRNILVWDEAVMMPEGAGETLAHSLATLNGMTQKMLISKKNKKLIDAAKNESLSTWDQANLAWMEKKYLHATAVPVKLMQKLTKDTFASQQAWRKLRAENNWKAFLPYFEKTFKTVKAVADRCSDVFQMSPYDALLDEYAPGFNQSSIDVIFDNLKQTLPSLVQKIIQQQANKKIVEPNGPFDIAKQKKLGIKAMEALQFDFYRGRLDVSHHPFCIGESTDVRITTRYDESEFISSLTGICHETGHGLYEQCMPKEWRGQPVGRIHSMAMHESQSLLIEMQLCRAPEFYEFLLPDIQQLFGMQEAFSKENLESIVTRVKQGLIRVDADEVTYPLHIILRYEMEKKLLNNEIRIRDLPAYWDEGMQKYLGISTRENFKDGVMQDVHWPAGAFGYFPAYTLGRMIGAQLFATFMKQEANFFNQVKKGDFSALKNWLQKNVYDYASSLPTNDLLKKVTGSELDSNYFLNHIKQRYLQN
jgi:carboxypeptidase Taq